MECRASFFFLRPQSWIDHAAHIASRSMYQSGCPGASDARHAPQRLALKLIAQSPDLIGTLRHFDFRAEDVIISIDTSYSQLILTILCRPENLNPKDSALPAPFKFEILNLIEFTY